MKTKILILCLAAFLSGNVAMASENTINSSDLSSQNSSSDNKICSLVTNELVKEVLKQTIYTVGNTVLQKYVNSNGSSSFIPGLPSTTSTPSTSTTSTTSTTGTSTTVTPSAQGDVIIIK